MSQGMCSFAQAMKQHLEQQLQVRSPPWKVHCHAPVASCLLQRLAGRAAGGCGGIVTPASFKSLRLALISSFPQGYGLALNLLSSCVEAVLMASSWPLST